MNLRVVGREEFERVSREKLTPLEALITEFINMDTECVEVENFSHKNAMSASASIKAACRRMNCGVDCKMRNGKVYLLRKRVK